MIPGYGNDAMPIEDIPATDLAYCLIAYDECGNEREEVIDGGCAA